MTAPKELLSIKVVDAALGNKWTLTIAGKILAGGYAKNLWASLDDANGALAGFVTHIPKMIARESSDE